jgi:hypothetical protein
MRGSTWWQKVCLTISTINKKWWDHDWDEKGAVSVVYASWNLRTQIQDWILWASLNKIGYHIMSYDIISYYIDPYHIMSPYYTMNTMFCFVIHQLFLFASHKGATATYTCTIPKPRQHTKIATQKHIPTLIMFNLKQNVLPNNWFSILE